MRTVFQNAHPPCVVLRRGHVIRDDVEKKAETACRGFLVQRREIFFAAQLRIQGHRVDDIVAMRTPLARLQDRRQVEIADAQLREIRHDALRTGKREAGVELQAVRGAGDAVHFGSRFPVARPMPLEAYIRADRRN